MNSSSLFGPGVANVWGGKKRGRKQRTGLTGGANLPPEISAALGEAELYFINGNNEKAIEMLSEVSLKAPKLPEPYSILALIYESSGDAMKALQLYVLTATYTPKAGSLHVWTKVAELASELGELDQAIFALKRCINLATSHEFYQQKIRVFLRQKNVNNAKSTLNKLLSRFKDQEHFLVEFGNLALSLGYSDLAIGSYTRYLFFLLGSQQVRADLFPTTAITPNQSPKHLEYTLGHVSYLYEALYKAVDALVEKADGLPAAMELVELCGEWTLTARASLPPDANASNTDIPELPLQVVVMYAVCKFRQESDAAIAEAMSMLKNVFALVDQGDLLSHLLVSSSGGGRGGGGSAGSGSSASSASSAGEEYLPEDTADVYILEALSDDVDLLRQLTRTAVELVNIGVNTRAQKLLSFLDTCLRSVGRKQIVLQGAEGSEALGLTAAERAAVKGKVTRDIPQLWCQLAASYEALEKPEQAIAAYKSALAICANHAGALMEYARLSRTLFPAEVGAAQELLARHVAVLVREFEEQRQAQAGGPGSSDGTGSGTVTGTGAQAGSESAVKRRGNKRAAGSGDAPGAVDEDFARLRRTLEAASASLPVLDAHGDEDEGGGGGARQAGGAGAGAMEVVEDDPQGVSSSDESGEDFEMDLDSDLGLNAEDGSDEEESDHSSSDSMHDRNRANRAASQQVAQLHWRMANKTTQFAQDDLKSEILAVVEWARLLFADSNMHAFCSVVVPILEAWAAPAASSAGARSGGGSTAAASAPAGGMPVPKLGRKLRNKEAQTVSMYQLALSGTSADPSVSMETLLAALDPQQTLCFHFISSLVRVAHLDQVLSKDALLSLAAETKVALDKLELTAYGAEILLRSNMKGIEKSSYSGGRNRASSVKYVEYSALDASATADDATRKVALSGAANRSGSPSGQVIIAWNKIRRPVEDPLITAATRLSESTGLLARRLFEQPEDIGVANSFYREVIEKLQDQQTSSNVFELQLPLSRLAVSAPKSCAAQLIAGHELATQRKHSLALERYLASFCLDPTQPLTALTLGSYLLMLAQHKLTKQRHEVMFKGIAFMHRYLTLRRGAVSSPVTRAVDACLSSSSGNADIAAASSSCSSSSGASRTVREESLTAAQMHELSLYQETLYNLGRAFHDMKLLHLACEQYTRALEIARVYAYLRDGDSAVTRQAAHNLVQIYKRSGAKDMALEVMQQFLTM